MTFGKTTGGEGTLPAFFSGLSGAVKSRFPLPLNPEKAEGPVGPHTAYFYRLNTEHGYAAGFSIPIMDLAP